MLAGFNEQSTCGTSARLGRGPRIQLPARGRAARRRRTAKCWCFWRGKGRFGPEIVAMLPQGATGLADLRAGLPVLKIPTGPKTLIRFQRPAHVALPKVHAYQQNRQAIAR
jgi:hypothetical protein